MSCMKNYIELGMEIVRKELPKPLEEYSEKEWYEFAYKKVTGKELPENWKNDKALLKAYLPANIIDKTLSRNGRR
jgi:hypothetical protein